MHAHRAALDERDAVGDLGDHAAQAERRAHARDRRPRARGSGAPARRAPASIARPAVRACSSAAPSRRSRSASAARASSLGASRRAALLPARRAQLLAQRLELAAMRREVALGLDAGALALVGDGGCGRLGRGALGLLVAGRLLAQRCRLGALALGLGAQPHRGLLGARGLAQQPLGLDALGREALARPLDDARVEPEPAGDLERVRRAGPAERERVGGRERLGVEADGAVERAGRRARPLLDLGVVRRRDRQRRALRELVEQGPRERRALDRVGAGGDLVEQHERARRRRLEHVHEVAEVPRERRERGRDRLLVADVGEHVGEDGHARPLGRHVQAALVEQGAAARASSARPSCRRCWRR